MLANFAALFRRAEASLFESGTLARGNLGVFHEGISFLDYVKAIGRPRSPAEVKLALMNGFDSVRKRVFGLIGEEARVASSRRFGDYVSGAAFE